MVKIPEAKDAETGELIKVEEALDARDAEHPIDCVCPECGEPVGPHREGGHTGAYPVC
jgi:hypothetical protein